MKKIARNSETQHCRSSRRFSEDFRAKNKNDDFNLPFKKRYIINQSGFFIRKIPLFLKVKKSCSSITITIKNTRPKFPVD